MSTLDQALFLLLFRREALQASAQKWLIVNPQSSLSSRLQEALHPKGRSVALAEVAMEVVVTEGHPLRMEAKDSITVLVTALYGSGSG